ncbi:hypothetical protein [Herbaspirillum autotrophicum]|uniref:hypothetical protein n=1 Tax=Herbaspirillum autotrophicum TaxID=180195 RepID=UPI0012EEDDD8|nr:hypothetical protein [Herbaspirillum autotrophicum]
MKKIIVSALLAAASATAAKSLFLLPGNFLPIEAKSCVREYAIDALPQSIGYPCNSAIKSLQAIFLPLLAELTRSN